MKKKFEKKLMQLAKSSIGDAIIFGLIGLLVVTLAYGISWLVTCGIIKLICLCFGLTFKWTVATGIWLILCLIKTVTLKFEG